MFLLLARAPVENNFECNKGSCCTIVGLSLVQQHGNAECVGSLVQGLGQHSKAVEDLQAAADILPGDAEVRPVFVPQ
jgi:hypothetical protein